MKKITILLLLVLFACQLIWSNNLNITNVTKNGDNQLSFDVSWDNSWWVSTYRDASWIFVKYKDSSGQWHHVDITSATASGFTTFTFADNKGVMVSRATSGIGTITGTVTVNFSGGSLGPLPDFKVFGIEMVYINQGAFYVGDGSSTNRFYRGDDNTLPYYVQNSNEITVGNTVNDIDGEFLTTNIPATYPTGYDAFYTMKYEVTNEQYAEFLNTLTFVQQQARTESDLTDISTTGFRYVMGKNSNPPFRSSISCDANTSGTNPITFYCDTNNNEIPNEANDGQNIAALYLSVNDCLSYLDWAAMRPITDMEYEKAARGQNVTPINGEFANGTTMATAKGAYTNFNSPSESVTNVGTDGLMNFNAGSPMRVGAFATATSTRLQSGASYYGVMELSGNVHELTILSINSVLSLNLNFTNSFGDGLLDINGLNNKWNFMAFFGTTGGNYAYPDSRLQISNRSYYTGNLDFRDRINYSSNPRGCR